jgi:periplasmic protein TonB
MNPHNDKTDLAQRLIVRAAHRAPATLAQRLEEEWLADLGSRTGSLSRLRLALGCCWAIGVITRDLRVPQLAASGAAAAPKHLWGELRYALPLLSRRTVAFLAIAAVHVLIIYVFVSGLAQHVAAAIPTLTHGFVELPSTPQHPMPAPKRTDIHLTTIAVPLDPSLLPKFEFGPDAPAAPDRGPQDTGGTEQPLAPQPVQRTAGGPGKGFPNTDDYYPAASRRIAETGAALVRVCVDTQGRLTTDPTLAASSGSRRIDAGALNLAKAGSGHYRPTLEDGAPVNSCFPYRIRFTLSN